MMIFHSEQFEYRYKNSQIEELNNKVAELEKDLKNIRNMKEEELKNYANNVSELYKSIKKIKQSDLAQIKGNNDYLDTFFRALAIVELSVEKLNDKGVFSSDMVKDMDPTNVRVVYFTNGPLGSASNSNMFSATPDYYGSYLKKKDDYFQEISKLDLNTVVPQKAETQKIQLTDIVNIEKQIFDALARGEKPGKFYYDALNNGVQQGLLSEKDYKIFLSIANAIGKMREENKGMVEINGKKQFFMTWKNFESIFTSIKNASDMAGNTITGLYIVCANKEQAEAFNYLRDNIASIKSEGDIREKANQKYGKSNISNNISPFIFVYNGTNNIKLEPAYVDNSLQTPEIQKQQNDKLSSEQHLPTYKYTSTSNFNVNNNRESITEVRPLHMLQQSVLPVFRIIKHESESRGTINYNSSQQLMYARNFDPKSKETKEMVRELALQQLSAFLADKGKITKDLKNMTLKEKEELLSQIFNGMNLEEKVTLLSQMKIVGSATLENVNQWNENYKLAYERGRMLAEEIVKIMFGKVSKKYVDQIKIEARVVSPFAITGKVDEGPAKETLNSIMKTIEENAKNNNQDAHILYNILLGNYNDARNLASGNKELINLITNIEKQSKGKPAIVKRDEGYEINNLELCQKLWASQDGGIGLRFESVGVMKGKTEQRNVNSAKKQLGAYFVSVLEQGFSRSASLCQNQEAKLGIHIDYFGESNNNIVARFSVGYQIGNEDEVFYSEQIKNGRVDVYLNGKKYEAKFEKNENGKSYFTLEVPSDEFKGKDIRLEAEAKKSDTFTSGRVSAEVIIPKNANIPRVPEVESPKIQPQSFAIRLDQTFFSPILVNSDLTLSVPAEAFAYSNLFRDNLTDAFYKAGINYEYDESSGKFNFKNLDGRQVASFINNLPNVWENYFYNTKVTTKDNKEMTIKEVFISSGYVSNEDFDAFITALKAGNLGDAIKYIRDEKVRFHFNTFFNTLSKMELIEIINKAQSAQFGAMVNFEVDLNKILPDTTLYLYYNIQTGDFVVTDTKPFAVHSGGMRLVHSFKGLGRIEKAEVGVSAGGTKIVSPGTDIPAQWYVGLTGNIGMRLSDFLGTLISADIQYTFQSPTEKKNSFGFTIPTSGLVNLQALGIYSPTNSIKLYGGFGFTRQVNPQSLPFSQEYLKGGFLWRPFSDLDLNISVESTFPRGQSPSYRIIFNLGL